MEQIADDLMPYPSKEFRVASGVMRYLDQGPGDNGSKNHGAGDQVILCVHGNPTWSFYYRNVVDRFQSTHRVIAVDHLGCGRSDKPPRGHDVNQGQFPYTLAAHRDNLVSLIDHLDLKRVTLLAHDWGGAIGLSSLVERRERFERIILLNTAAFPPPYVPWRIAACRFPVLGTAAVRGINAFARAAVTMAMSRNRMNAETSSGLLAPYDNWQNRVAIDAFVRDIPMSKSHPTGVTLTKLESDLPSLAGIPSMLIWGMKDWCFRPECLRRFQEVWPQAESVEIDDAGHYVMEDATTETLDAISRFMDG